MSNPIRLFLILEAVLFIGAASTWMRPWWLRNAGLFGQGFALLGTLVGLATIAIGVGPRTAPDIAPTWRSPQSSSGVLQWRGERADPLKKICPRCRIAPVPTDSRA